MFNTTNSQSLNQQLNSNSFQFSYSNQFNYNMSVNYCQSQLDFINNEQNRSPCFDNYNISNPTSFKTTNLRLPKATFTHPYQRPQYNNISYASNMQQNKIMPQLAPSVMRQPLVNIYSNQQIVHQSIQSQYKIKDVLNEILKSTKKSNEAIFDEISALIANTKNQDFIQALSTSIVRSCFHSSDAFNLTTLKTRLPLLSLFIIDRNQQEIELINALKSVAHDDNISNNMLQTIYVTLFNNDLVKLAVFLTRLNHIELDNLLNTSSSTVSNQINVNASTSNSIKQSIITDDAKDKNETAIKTECAKKNSENEESETSCPICLSTLTELKKQKVKLMSGSCGHIMCHPCAKSYYNLNKKKSSKECPVCRKLIATSTVHQIYI